MQDHSDSKTTPKGGELWRSPSGAIYWVLAVDGDMVKFTSRDGSNPTAYTPLSAWLGAMGMKWEGLK